MQELIEPEKDAARFARAWREAAADAAGGCAPGRIDDATAAVFARAMATALRDLDNGGAERLSAAAARLGASRARRGSAIYDLVSDLAALERAALELQLGDPRAVQAAVACALLAGTAAFSRVAAQRERKRVRDARHDLLNAVGAVRNAILLLDDETSSEARDRFLSIARRNSAAAQDLVREHLSDTAAVPAWLECSTRGADPKRPLRVPRPLQSRESAAQ